MDSHINHSEGRHSCEAGIQENTGFRVKPGMTKRKRLTSLSPQWFVGKTTNDKSKKLFAETDLLFLHVALDDRGNAAEKVRDARHFKLINHIRP